MTQEAAARLIEENLPAIYGYAYARLYDKSRAEDLAGEIVLAILESAEALRQEEAFWGFVWKVAENTFRTFLKRERLAAQCHSLEREGLTEVLVAPAEEDKQEDLIYRLRRELSLLGRRHRAVCVDYYVRNMSCAAIAEAEGISVEMVKQLLFKARKILKEGMEMERKLGEKSYNPGTLRLDFWGDWNHYGHICDRKLPGAILLAAYDHPLTAAELSVEVGVAMPYLEDEIDLLVTAGLLRRNGKRYETAIVILKDEYEKAFAREIKPLCDTAAARLFTALEEKLPLIRTLDFHGKDFDENRLLGGLVNIVVMRAYEWSHFVSPAEAALKLPLGGHGLVFGYDNDYENHHFIGVTTRTSADEGKEWFTAVNYRALVDTAYYDHARFRDRTRAMCSAMRGDAPDPANETLPNLIENGFIAVRDDRLVPRFLTFNEAVWEELMDILRPDYEAVAACMIEASDRATALLEKVTPAHLRPSCADIVKIHHRMDVAAFIMESLLSDGKLTLPKEKTPIAVFGVKEPS